MGYELKKLFVSKSIFFLLFCFSLILLPELFAQQNRNVACSLQITAGTLKANFMPPRVINIGKYDRIAFPDLPNYGKPGEPAMPVKTVKYLIPFGREIESVNVVWEKKEKIKGSFVIEPAQRPIPLNYQGRIKSTLPDPLIYNSAQAFPGKLYSLVSIQQFKNYKIAIINLYPVEYQPLFKNLYYYRNLELQINLKQAASHTVKKYSSDLKDIKAVKKFVDNSDVCLTYADPEGIKKLANGQDDYEYVIITSQELAASIQTYNFQALAAHKASKWGLTTLIKTTESIYSNSEYSGLRPDGTEDNQTRIRNFIIDYAQNHNTKYVLLAGDGDAEEPAAQNGETEIAPIIPHRGLSASYWNWDDGPVMITNNDIPADLYYACLDGTFDADADGIYGEVADNVDFIAEVYVSRAPVDSETEMSNFVYKTITYENSQADYLTSAYTIGEWLDNEYDEQYPEILISTSWGKDFLEEIRLGTSANGYTTAGIGSSGYFNVQTLYDYDYDSNPEHYGDYNQGWLKPDLLNIMNSGVHVLNHVGHGNADSICGYKQFTNFDADNLTNTDYFLGYTQSCYSGAFDNKSAISEYEDEYVNYDCNVEHFVTEEHGAFAFIANSRSGWFYVGTTEGPSQRFNRMFWDKMFEGSTTNLGKILQESKQANIGLIGDDNAYRWCYYTINLFGDPHTPLTSALLSPGSFIASNIAFDNSSWITLQWKNSSRADLKSVMVRYRTDGIYPTGPDDGTLLCSRSAVSGTLDMFNHTNVLGGQTYHYVAFGFNEDGDCSGATGAHNRAAVTVMQRSGQMNPGKSDCFVATVCYGSADDRNVRTLRKFRDLYLIKTVSGREFINGYYLVGPYLANIIRNDFCAKALIRKLLKPAVTFADFCIKIKNEED